jgi:hypothetical protein
MLAVWAVLGTVLAKAWQPVSDQPCMSCSPGVVVPTGGPYIWLGQQYDTYQQAWDAIHDPAVLNQVKAAFIASKVANRQCAICSSCLTMRCGRTVNSDSTDDDFAYGIAMLLNGKYGIGIEVTSSFTVWICCGSCGVTCDPN